MSIIDDIMTLPAARWVDQKKVELPERGRYRATNAIRSLVWADRIFEIDLPIPATYCALHATEEAVAAFVSVAKECGYGDDAKINIRDHQAKAVVSLVTQTVINLIQKFEPAVAYKEDDDVVAARLTVDGEHRYSEASLNLVEFLNDGDNLADEFWDDLVGQLGDIHELRDLVLRGQEARNGIFYATSTYYPSGFHEPEVSLRRECQLSLALLWASIDMNRKKGTKIPLISQALRTANMVITDVKSAKRK